MSNLPYEKYVCIPIEYLTFANQPSAESRKELKANVPTAPIVITFEKSLLRCLIDSNNTRRALGIDTDKAQDAVVDQECPKCQHPQMSYRTAQLRGLDEGQTIFYSCLNKECGHHYTLNS